MYVRTYVRMYVYRYIYIYMYITYVRMYFGPQINLILRALRGPKGLRLQVLEEIMQLRGPVPG